VGSKRDRIILTGVEVVTAVHGLYQPEAETRLEGELPQSVPKNQVEAVGEKMARRPEQAQRDQLNKPQPPAPTAQPIRRDNSRPNGRYTPPKPPHPPRTPNYGAHPNNREGRRAAEREARRAPQAGQDQSQRRGAPEGGLRYRSEPPGQAPMTGTLPAQQPKQEQPKQQQHQQPKQQQQQQQRSGPAPRQYSGSTNQPPKEAPRRSTPPNQQVHVRGTQPQGQQAPANNQSKQQRQQTSGPAPRQYSSPPNQPPNQPPKEPPRRSK
jgi:hypothetical protein